MAIGLVHTPTLLFLDEPSTGLDPQNRVNLQEQITRLHREQGTTIVLTTHYLEEADTIADRVVVIDHGVVIADDSAARLKSSLGDLVSLGFDTVAAATVRCRAGRSDPRSDRRPRRHRRHRPRRARARPGCRPRHRPGLGGHDRRAGSRCPGPTLDDVFLDLTGRSLRETGNEHTSHTDSTTENEGAAA